MPKPPRVAGTNICHQEVAGNKFKKKGDNTYHSGAQVATLTSKTFVEIRLGSIIVTSRRVTAEQAGHDVYWCDFVSERSEGTSGPHRLRHLMRKH